MEPMSIIISEIAFSSIIESPFMEPFLCMNITTIPLNINTNIRISSRFFYPLKVVPRKSVQFPKSKFKYRTYSFQPSKLQPEYLESTSFIRCSRHFYSSVFFSIPTDTLDCVPRVPRELRDFCDFDAVPDGSKFTRFKQDFLLDLRSSKTLDFVMLLFLSVPILA